MEYEPALTDFMRDCAKQHGFDADAEFAKFGSYVRCKRQLGLPDDPSWGDRFETWLQCQKKVLDELSSPGMSLERIADSWNISENLCWDMEMAWCDVRAEVRRLKTVLIAVRKAIGAAYGQARTGELFVPEADGNAE